MLLSSFIFMCERSMFEKLRQRLHVVDISRPPASLLGQIPNTGIYRDLQRITSVSWKLTALWLNLFVL